MNIIIKTLKHTKLVCTHKWYVFKYAVKAGIPYRDFYACGPMPMLKAISNTIKVDGQLSLEERMGCGFGTCMGCTIKTKNGYKRVCKEGPVFGKEELIGEN